MKLWTIGYTTQNNYWWSLLTTDDDEPIIEMCHNHIEPPTWHTSTFDPVISYRGSYRVELIGTIEDFDVSQISRIH